MLTDQYVLKAAAETAGRAFLLEPLGHELEAEWLRVERLEAEWLRSKPHVELSSRSLDEFIIKFMNPRAQPV
jgi:hypothetical protein